MTFTENEIKVNHSEVVNTFYEYFSEINKITEKYGIILRIGERYSSKEEADGFGKGKHTTFRDENIFLNPYGKITTETFSYQKNEKGDKHGYTFSRDDSFDKFNLSKLLRSKSLYKPAVILENLLSELISSSKVNEEKIKETKVVMRILKSLTDNGNGDTK